VCLAPSALPLRSLRLCGGLGVIRGSSFVGLDEPDPRNNTNHIKTTAETQERIGSAEIFLRYFRLLESGQLIKATTQTGNTFFSLNNEQRATQGRIDPT